MTYEELYLRLFLLFRLVSNSIVISNRTFRGIALQSTDENVIAGQFVTICGRIVWMYIIGSFILLLLRHALPRIMFSGSRAFRYFSSFYYFSKLIPLLHWFYLPMTVECSENKSSCCRLLNFMEGIWWSGMNFSEVNVNKCVIANMYPWFQYYFLNILSKTNQ